MHTESPRPARLWGDMFNSIRVQGILPEELVVLVEKVVPLLAQARSEAVIALPEADACASVEAMFAGSPLLLRQDFPFDEPQALKLTQPLLDLLEKTSGEAAKATQALRQALESGRLDLPQLFRAYAAGDDAPFTPWRDRLPGSPRALDFLATSALWPGLNTAAELLAKRLPEDLPHDHGHCPLCGSLPYISLLRGKEGKRFGVCSFCGHEYRIRRIACAYCDEADQNRLKLFQVAEYPGLRVDVCESCKMYIKTVDAREGVAGAMPALDDMASVALDAVAQRQGYKRPTLSAWGF